MMEVGGFFSEFEPFRTASSDRDAPRIFNAIAQAEDLDGKPDMQHPALLRVSAVLSGTLAEVLSETLLRYFSAKF